MTYAIDHDTLYIINKEGSIYQIEKVQEQYKITPLWKSPYSKLHPQENSKALLQPRVPRDIDQPESEEEKLKAQFISAYLSMIFAYLGNGKFGIRKPPQIPNFSEVKEPLPILGKIVRKVGIFDPFLCIVADQGVTIVSTEGKMILFLSNPDIIDVISTPPSFHFLLKSGHIFSFPPNSYQKFRAVNIFSYVSSREIYQILENGDVVRSEETISQTQISQTYKPVKHQKKSYDYFNIAKNMIFMKKMNENCFSYSENLSDSSSSFGLMDFFSHLENIGIPIPSPILLFSLQKFSQKCNKRKQIKNSHIERDSWTLTNSPIPAPDYDHYHLFLNDYENKMRTIVADGLEEIGFMCGDQIQLSDSTYADISQFAGPDFTLNSTCAVLGVEKRNETTNAEKNNKLNVCLVIMDSIGNAYHDIKHIAQTHSTSTGYTIFFVEMDKQSALFHWRLLWRNNALLKDLKISEKYTIQVDTNPESFGKIPVKTNDIVEHKKYGRGQISGTRCNQIWVKFEKTTRAFTENTFKQLKFIGRPGIRTAVIKSLNNLLIELEAVDDQISIPPLEILETIPFSTNTIVTLPKRGIIGAIVGKTNRFFLFQSPYNVEFRQDEDGKYKYLFTTLPITFVNFIEVISSNTHTTRVSLLKHHKAIEVEVTNNIHPFLHPGDLFRTKDGLIMKLIGKAQSKSEQPKDDLFLFENQKPNHYSQLFTETEALSFSHIAASFHKSHIIAYDIESKKEVELSLDISLSFDSDINETNIFKEHCNKLNNGSTNSEITVLFPSDCILYHNEIRYVVGYDKTYHYYISTQNSDQKSDIPHVQRINDDEIQNVRVLCRYVSYPSEVTLPMYKEDIIMSSELSSSDEETSNEEETSSETITFYTDVFHCFAKNVMPLHKDQDSIILGVTSTRIVFTKDINDGKCFLY